MEAHIGFQPNHEGPNLFGMEFFERRKALRREARDGVISIAGVHVNAATTRLLDISGQGLAFEHISPQALSETTLDINLLVVDQQKKKDLFFHLVKAEVLSIAEIHGSWGKRGGCARRYGLHFVGLSRLEHANLVNFLGDSSAIANSPWQQVVTAPH